MPDTGCGGGAVVEWINEVPTLRHCRYCLFDFDGTLSLIRAGWQEVMVGYMVEVLQATGTRETAAQLHSVVTEFVTELTGRQTIYQMIRLAEEVRSRGGTPLDPVAYKHEYLRRLWSRIENRVKGLETGTIDPNDMLVPGSMRLLRLLRSAGITLYLASGTDEPYVKHEAAVLGIDRFFAGVFGAVDDYKSFSKEKVIQKILAEHRLSGSELLGFGDGFVEIENVKAVGGTAIGVASDEQNRRGIDVWKRERLIRAGADAIIADYRQLDWLEQLLGCRASS